VKAHSIAAVNRLPSEEKQAIYFRLVPPALGEHLGIAPDFLDSSGRPLARLQALPGSSDVILEVKHTYEAEDPALYAHLTDTVNGQILVLLYVINDPFSPRFDVDRMADGTPTAFGTRLRNIKAEREAFRAGLAPGQIHRGLRILRQSIEAFERFVTSLGHDAFFVDPLYYHNAIIFEGYGFAYQRGLHRMEEINRGFAGDGDLCRKLDGSSVFRSVRAAGTTRGRSWAIHDGILGVPFSGVTMYRTIGRNAGINTFPGSQW
jgi:hypothetical protein